MTNAGVSSAGEVAGRPSGMETGSDKKKRPKGNVAILKEMRDRLGNAEQFEAENRKNYVYDTTLSSSNDQWPDDVKKLRGASRPTLTFNRLNGVIKNVVGDYRQNKLAISVIPAGGDATEDKAEILADLIRSIEMDSVAEVAYVNGLECSSRGNIGWMRLVTEYEGADTFNQKLKIKPVANPLTVYCDPAARERSRRDANWMIVTEMVSKEDFQRDYPDATASSFTGDADAGLSSDIMDWVSDDEIRVAEYYTKEIVEARLVAFDNGAVVQIDDDSEIEVLKQIGWNPVKERKANRTNVHWRKCSGIEVLEERIYKTQYIPLIPILGEEVNVEGKVLLRSLIFYARDAQRMLNYWKTAATETVALAPKAPWLLTPEQIEELKEQWDRANTTPFPYLLYNFVEGQPVPTQIQPKAQAIGEMALGGDAGQELQYTTGVFDASLGQKSNAISGVAEGERQSQSATSTFLWVDNLRSAIEHLGRVIIDWIPIAYDTERVVRVVGLEGEARDEVINQKKYNPLLCITEILNDITVGKYDVVVQAGPAFASRRREAVSGMMDFIKAMPQLGALIADLAVKNMDWPGADEIAERLKRALPPQMTTDPDSPEGQAAAAQAQQKQGQQAQLAQTVVGMKLQQAQDKTESEHIKAGATVAKAQAEVIKAKADTIQAVAGAHKSEQEAVHHAVNLAPPPQPVAVPEPTLHSPRLLMSPEQNKMYHPYGSRREDIERHQEKQAHDMKSAEDMKAMLGALANHLIQSHNMNAQQAAKTHELMGKMVENHAQVAQAIHRQNQIAEAPTKMVRDKVGKALYSQKDLSNVS